MLFVEFVCSLFENNLTNWLEFLNFFASMVCRWSEPMLEWKWNEIGENRMNRLGWVQKSRFYEQLKIAKKLNLTIFAFWTWTFWNFGHSTLYEPRIQMKKNMLIWWLRVKIFNKHNWNFEKVEVLESLSWRLQIYCDYYWHYHLSACQIWQLSRNQCYGLPLTFERKKRKKKKKNANWYNRCIAASVLGP